MTSGNSACLKQTRRHLSRGMQHPVHIMSNFFRICLAISSNNTPLCCVPKNLTVSLCDTVVGCRESGYTVGVAVLWQEVQWSAPRRQADEAISSPGGLFIAYRRSPVSVRWSGCGPTCAEPHSRIPDSSPMVSVRTPCTPKLRISYRQPAVERSLLRLC